MKKLFLALSLIGLTACGSGVMPATQSQAANSSTIHPMDNGGGPSGGPVGGGGAVLVKVPASPSPSPSPTP